MDKIKQRLGRKPTVSNAEGSKDKGFGVVVAAVFGVLQGSHILAKRQWKVVDKIPVRECMIAAVITKSLR